MGQPLKFVDSLEVLELWRLTSGSGVDFPPKFSTFLAATFYVGCEQVLETITMPSSVALGLWVPPGDEKVRRSSVTRERHFVIKAFEYGNAFDIIE